MKEEIKVLTEIGYVGDFSLSHIIDWIRISMGFNIWIEHGVNIKDPKNKSKKISSHDVTTNLGCHRGSHNTYEDAQAKGIEIFIRYHKQQKPS